MEVYGHGRMKFSIQILIFTLYKPSVKIPILQYYRVFPLIGNFLFVSRKTESENTEEKIVLSFS